MNRRGSSHAAAAIVPEYADEGADRSAGLSEAEAARRLRQHGPNLLPQPDRRNWLRIALGVLHEPMLVLLIGAASIYLLLGDPKEAAILAASIVLVIALTTYQEYRSERALQALRDLSSPRARVLRDGQARLVAARELVVGDIVLIAEGDRVPADARLLDDNDLMVDESLLTGESVPVRRTAESHEPHGPHDDNRIHASTLVVRGHGTAQIVATGADTAVGRIGSSLRTLRTPPTPMQREIRLAVLMFAALGVASSVLLMLLYVTVHGDWLQGALAGVTLAMANIPEEFPVVLTVFLALGAWRMTRHSALVRRPPAIEALGSVTVLCTDKTGTLTENRMSVVELAAAGQRASLPGDLPQPLRAVLACADAASPDRPVDPMETAIRKAFADSQPSAGREGWERVREYPLSRDLLAIAHVWRTPGHSALQVACKGAPEAVAALSGLSEERRRAMLDEVAAMARRGLRVIAAAQAHWDNGPETLPGSASGFPFEWLGLIGLADPLRQGVREAVGEARAAGVRVIALTGDHLETARAIALQAGIAEAREVMLGDALESLDDAALRRAAQRINVFARVKPEHKLALVEALRSEGQVVAMTGDGVNDAPALMAAHVGVAMGARGTDVAREAASIVLLDDNFVTVMKAIRHGRVIYDNIVRAVRYILAVHVPITGLALLPLLFSAPLVLLPLHVVFLELIIDPASTLVFEREPPADDVMRRPPRPPTARLLDARTLFGSIGHGLLVFAMVAAAYLLGRNAGVPDMQLGAIAFVSLVAGNLGLIVFHRAGGSRQHWWRQRNPAFWTVTLGALTLLFVITRFATPAAWFGFAPPPFGLTLAALLLPLAALTLAAQLRTLAARVRHRRAEAA